MCCCAVRTKTKAKSHFGAPPKSTLMGEEISKEDNMSGVGHLVKTWLLRIVVIFIYVLSHIYDYISYP
jgi:hypothetical protein